MIRRIDARGRSSESLRGTTDLVPRAEFDVDAASAAVRPLVEDVRERGEAALIEQVERFDGVRLDSVRVPGAAIADALAELDPEVRRAFEASAARLRATCEAELPRDVVTEVGPGRVTQRNVPVSRVGLYVPGDQAPLVSSVMMNAVPAQVAGVESLALASPARAEHGGLPDPSILAACALLGIDEVYAVGGAGAVAMFAYGYDGEDGPGCRKVDVITGPANIYGVAAKRLVAGTVGIDSEAGPTEIAILADDSADPRFVAADLISQAEHDPMAAAVLVTDSPELAEAVEAELERQVALTKHHERVSRALSGEQSAIIVVDDLEVGQEAVDAYAAEHLEIHTVDAAERAATIRNAGAIFVGPYAPVSLGDYAAGSNHVLPTAGCACHSSGLSVRAFLKNVQVVEYSHEALAGVADDIAALSAAEDLPGHGDAVRIRLEG